MANKNKNDLAAFKKWLIDVRMVSKASATVYASRVRKILSKLETLTQDEIDRVMTSLLNDSFHSHMSCWNHFKEFCEDKGIHVPIPTVKKASRRSARDPELPDFVTLAVVQVLNDCPMLKPHLLVGMRWEHVVMKGEAPWWITDPTNPSYMYHVPANPMRIICDWANGLADIEKERPLIPRVALSMVPMSKAVIKRSISGRTRNRLQ